MYLLPQDLVSKNQLSTNQNLFNALANLRNDRWTCIALHSVYTAVLLFGISGAALYNHFWAL